MLSSRWPRSPSHGKCSKRFCGSSRNCGRSRHRRHREKLDVMHSRATDRRSASKCQGKWPDQTLEQAFGLPKVYTSRLSCKRAGKTRTLMPVGIHLGTLGLRLSAPRMQRSCAMRLCLKMSGGRVLMRQLLVCFSILFLLGDSAYWTRGDTAGTPVDNGSPTPSTSGDARGHSGDQSDIVGKLRLGGDKSSTDTTRSQGLTLGANGPIPVIVLDQFGYPTKASKIAVIRDPQMGYDNVVSFTPGTTYAVVDKSTGKIVKKGPPIAWNGGATDEVSGDKAWWFDFTDVEIPGTYTVVDIDKGLRSVEFEIDNHVY